eukprot:TCONS_00070904-protein
MAQNMFLYWGSGSTPCWRAMIVLEEKQLSGYGQKLVSFSAKEHKSEEIMKINPRGQVPTFKHGDIVLNESMGICYYLESQFKNQGTKLIPDDAENQALVLQRMYEVENIIDKANRKIMYYIWYNKESLDENLLTERRQALGTELKIWEEFLTNKKYITGDEFTMADAFFFPQIAILVRGSLSFENRPNLKRYYEELSQRPSIMASWPPHFKDTPPTEMFTKI